MKRHNTYPSGEIYVSKNEGIMYHLNSAEDTLAFLLDATENKRGKQITIPYLPFAREDRARDNKVFTLKAFATMVNNIEPSEVRLFDVHSEVGVALFNNVKHITQLDILTHYFNMDIAALEEAVVVAPDAGAAKKAFDVASVFKLPFIQGEKHRDPHTGKLSGFGLGSGDVDGKTALIVDDICDGGGTFLGLAGHLKERGAKKIVLYVTHGLFTKGVDILLENGIDEVWTTNTVTSNILNRENLKVRNLV